MGNCTASFKPCICKFVDIHLSVLLLCIVVIGAWMYVGFPLIIYFGVGVGGFLESRWVWTGNCCIQISFSPPVASVC